MGGKPPCRSGVSSEQTAGASECLLLPAHFVRNYVVDVKVMTVDGVGRRGFRNFHVGIRGIAGIAGYEFYGK